MEIKGILKNRLEALSVDAKQLFISIVNSILSDDVSVRFEYNDYNDRKELKISPNVTDVNADAMRELVEAGLIDKQYNNDSVTLDDESHYIAGIRKYGKAILLFLESLDTPTADDIADELQDIEYTAETENVSKTGKRLHVVASQLDSIEYVSYDRDEAMDYALQYSNHWVYLYIPKVNRFTPCVMYRDGEFINHPQDLRRVDLDDPRGLVAQHIK